MCRQTGSKKKKKAADNLIAFAEITKIALEHGPSPGLARSAIRSVCPGNNEAVDGNERPLL